MPDEATVDQGIGVTLLVLACVQGLLVGLKLCHALSWGWLAVLSPFAIVAGAGLTAFCVALGVHALIDLMDRLGGRA